MNLSQCVLLIELNAWEDECLVIIENLITIKKIQIRWKIKINYPIYG